MLNNPFKLFRLIPLGFLLVGLGLLAGAFFSYRSTQAFLSTAVATTGEVIGYERHNDGDGEISYFPVISFTPAHGDVVEFTSSTGGTREYAIGATVPLRYDPALPFNAMIDKPSDIWLATGILGGLGLVFTIVGGVILWFFRPSGALGQAAFEPSAEFQPADQVKVL